MLVVDSEAGEDATEHENARILVSISPQVQVRVAQADSGLLLFQDAQLDV